MSALGSEKSLSLAPSKVVSKALGLSFIVCWKTLPMDVSGFAADKYSSGLVPLTAITLKNMSLLAPYQHFGVTCRLLSARTSSKELMPGGLGLAVMMAVKSAV